MAPNLKFYPRMVSTNEHECKFTDSFLYLVQWWTR